MLSKFITSFIEIPFWTTRLISSPYVNIQHYPIGNTPETAPK